VIHNALSIRDAGIVDTLEAIDVNALAIASAHSANAAALFQLRSGSKFRI
jgi:hypothetical protein